MPLAAQGIVLPEPTRKCSVLTGSDAAKESRYETNVREQDRPAAAAGNRPGSDAGGLRQLHEGVLGLSAPHQSTPNQEEITMFAITPLVILVLALTAGGTAAVAEQQMDKKQSEQSAQAEVTEPAAVPALPERQTAAEDKAFEPSDTFNAEVAGD
jgi:hypothetical protein